MLLAQGEKKLWPNCEEDREFPVPGSAQPELSGSAQAALSAAASLSLAVTLQGCPAVQQQPEQLDRQVAADDSIFTRGNHDGISVYPLQQVDKSQQMGFPSELESAGLFLPSHKCFSSTWCRCQAQPSQKLLPSGREAGSRMALQTQMLNQRGSGQ